MHNSVLKMSKRFAHINIKWFNYFGRVRSFVFFFFLAALDLHYCTRAFFSCSKRGLPFIAVCGLLIVVASLVAEHGF